MRTIIVTLFAATIALAAVGTAGAAMMHHKMHFRHHGMACKGMYMFMDKKSHKCMNATA
jgi:hypothetical protein